MLLKLGFDEGYDIRVGSRAVSNDADRDGRLRRSRGLLSEAKIPRGAGRDQRREHDSSRSAFPPQEKNPDS